MSYQYDDETEEYQEYAEQELLNDPFRALLRRIRRDEEEAATLASIAMGLLVGVIVFLISAWMIKSSTK